MKIFKSALFKSSILYTLSTIINSAIPFFLLPILTRYLSPSDYGILTMFSLLVSVFGLFVGLNIYSSINRAYFEKNISFKVYVGNGLYVLILSSIISLIFISFIYKVTSVPKKNGFCLH